MDYNVASEINSHIILKKKQEMGVMYTCMIVPSSDSY